MIFTEIRKNMSIIKAHIITFLIKSFMIFMSLVPLNRAMSSFFGGRTINDDMFASSDINAIQEFLRASTSPNLGMFGFAQHTIVLVVGTIFLFFLFFLVVDGFIDAGMLNAIKKRKSASFFKGMRKYGFEFFKLRLMNVILFLIVLFAVLAPTGYFYLSSGFNSSMGILALLAIPTLFALKMFDHGKHLILRDGKKAGKAFWTSLKSLFSDGKNVLLLNIQTIVLFIVGYYIYIALDNSFLVDTSGKIWLMVILHQIVLFGKQLLRYSYMSGVGEITEKNVN